MIHHSGRIRPMTIFLQLYSRLAYIGETEMKELMSGTRNSQSGPELAAPVYSKAVVPNGKASMTSSPSQSYLHITN